MKAFKALFGEAPEKMKQNCILLPCISKGMLGEFQAGRIKRGVLYGCADAGSFSLIHTGIGAGFTGDAVLYLKNTPCRNIFLFGSCGLCGSDKGLGIGSIAAPSKSYDLESFSRLLFQRKVQGGIFQAHKKLLGDFLDANCDSGVKTVNCVSLSSLKLEEDILPLLREKNIDVVDMESSAFFAAAQYCGLKAMALFYVSDVIKKKPFYESQSSRLRSVLSSSIKESARLLCSFINAN